jgi:hypothetical protein
MGKDLAAQRKRLRLFRHPFRTLYYFSTCAASAGVRGCLWLARHRLTLTLLLPALAGYIFLKQTGAPSSLLAGVHANVYVNATCMCTLVYMGCPQSSDVSLSILALTEWMRSRLWRSAAHGRVPRRATDCKGCVTREPCFFS